MSSVDEAFVRANDHLEAGVAHGRAGQFEAAAASLTQAVALKPDWAEAHCHLAVVLDQLGSPFFSVAFERAAALAPENARIQRGAAAALMRHNELRRSLPLWQRAAALEPTVENLIELGTNHRLLGEHEAAVDVLRRAISDSPRNATALLELGAAYMELERLDEAEDALRIAVRESPRSLGALYNLASVLMLLGKSGESGATLRRLLDVDPSNVGARSNLLVVRNYDPDATDALVLGEAEEWGRRHADAAPKARPRAEDGESRRIRLGYFASDFSALAPFVPPLVEHHDRGAFEPFFYSTAPLPESFATALTAKGDRFREVGGFDDAALAQLIREDGIDVLVDLTQHLPGSRLLAFATGPAPVQIAWLAYPGTTGVPAMRFRLTDPYLDPEGGPEPYTEESIRLAGPFWPYAPKGSEPEPGALPALRNGYVTFGSLNAFSKVNDRVLDLWASVLRGVPGSRFVLLAPRGRSRDRVRARFASRDVDPSRIEFVDRRPHDEYLETYRALDVCLDTFPANGHTTSLDAFYMGVPVVTLAGDRVVARGGVSIARHLGLPVLIAEDAHAFGDVAAALALDLGKLVELRGSLRERMLCSPFMDGPRFVRHLEDAYREARSRVSPT